MVSDEQKKVTRTLVVTWGALAEMAGQGLSQLLVNRRGPAAAVTVVQAPQEGAPDDEPFNENLVAALNHISQPNISSLLAGQGWLLARPRDMQIFLVADVAAKRAGYIRALSQHIGDAIYRHLGLECAPTLIWLAPDNNDDAASCLEESAAPPFFQTILALNVLNEEGLRLSDPAALGLVAGELLWGLVATPLQACVPEWVAAHDTATLSSATPIASVGLAVWQWSPSETIPRFIRRWVQEVLSFWLAAPEESLTAPALHAWLQAQQLDREGLTARFTAGEPFAAPSYARLARHYPWPWQMRQHLQSLKQSYEADAARLQEQKQANNQIVGEIIRATGREFVDSLTTSLDGEPVGGMVAAVVWLSALAALCDDLYEQMLDDAAAYDGLDTDLAEERGEVEAGMRACLESWPGGYWRHWLGVGLRVWRWPTLAWRYWRLRQTGLRLAGLLAQQSVRQRQRLAQTAVNQTLAELARLARQWQGQVAELGDMLASWQRSEADESLTEGSPTAPDAPIYTDIPLNRLRFPEALYLHLFPDGRQEATWAAERLGGLGRQIGRLDETLFVGLHRLAEGRMAGVWQATAVTVLSAHLTTSADWTAWWQSAWQAATPLWRYDESRLPETARRPHDTCSWFIGAGASRLPEHLTAEGAVAAAELEQTSWLDSADRERLILFRLRRGLTAQAMAAGQ
ncbi:MAG: hypothetical protein IPM39_28125 [Chloroflexi bacterium]|nr:hypothetical protein [Chloroflexota bacterium]